MGAVEKTYAAALLEIAYEDGNAPEIDGELSQIAEIFGDNPEFMDILCAPDVADTEKTGLLSSVFGGRVTDTVLDFMCLLAVKGRIGRFAPIAREYRRGYYERAGIAEAMVTTAVPLGAKERAALKEKLEKKYSKRLIITEKVEPAIIGGVVVKIGDELLDGSVRTRLASMKQQIEEKIIV